MYMIREYTTYAMVINNIVITSVSILKSLGSNVVRIEIIRLIYLNDSSENMMFSTFSSENLYENNLKNHS